MLRCNACIRRTLSIVLDDASALHHRSTVTASPLRTRPLSPRQPWHPSRLQPYATATSAATQTQEYGSNPYPPTSGRRPPTHLNRAEPSRYTPPWRTSRGPSVARSTELDIPPTQQAVELEVRWLRDPLKLADRVVELLGQGSYFTALAITRHSSKDLQCTVSWNHLVDYNMAKGKHREAVKTYNEMKKRAQVPDARTYTTLFRGFGWAMQANKQPAILAEALKIYHAMFVDKSPVRPTVIHTNAVLKVCAFAGDMDALYGVASKLPEKGNGAPDTVTYYTILNGIRNSVDPVGLGVARSRAEVVRQGMRLWEDIKVRWTAGDLLMSEDLVCAMGRVLLIGGESGADEVLSLIEQTMGVPRQVRKLGDPARHGTKKLEEQPLDELLDDKIGGSTPAVSPSHESSAPIDDSSVPKALFAPIPNLSKTSLVRPSRNTLSLAIEACTTMSLPRPAQNYWGLLTSRPSPSNPHAHNIIPDSANYHSYLRLLRLQRASAQAVSLVSEMSTGALPVHAFPPPKTTTPPSLLAPKTFRIALSTCVRDKNNPNALTHATALLNIMTASLEDADAPALTTYLDLATSSPHSRDSPTSLLQAETAALPAWRNLRSLLAYSPSPASSPSSTPTKYPSQEAASNDGWAMQNARRKKAGVERGLREAEVSEAGRGLVRLYSRILDVGREELGRGEVKRVGGEKARVEAFLRKLMGGFGIEGEGEGGWDGEGRGRGEGGARRWSW